MMKGVIFAKKPGDYLQAGGAAVHGIHPEFI